MHPTRFPLMLAACLVPALVPAATPQVFYTTLAGLNESPPNASPGTGFALLTYTPNNGSLRVQAAFSGLVGTTTASHVHCCLVPPATNVIVATVLPTFTVFPLGVSAGSYDHTFDMTDPASWNPTFVTNYGGMTVGGAIVALLAGMANATAYFNIHTATYPGGEIRGNLTLDSFLIDGFE